LNDKHRPATFSEELNRSQRPVPVKAILEFVLVCETTDALKRGTLGLRVVNGNKSMPMALDLVASQSAKGTVRRVFPQHLH
jgi:hypothetical protein